MAVNKILEKLPVPCDSMHCVGIGGIGVSAIAELLLEGGFIISGSDQEYNENCDRLSGLGAVIAPAGHRVENLPSADCGGVIMTSAAALSNVEVAGMLRRGVMAWKRGEFLGELCRCYQRPVMVAGSHGKSSITAMLGWILYKCKVNSGLLLGAHYQDGSRHARLGDGDILVAEADESDGTISMLSGELALISNIDGDHAWTAEQKRQQDDCFRRFASCFNTVIYIKSDKTGEILSGMPHARALTESDLMRLDGLVPASFLGYERTNAALTLAAAEYLQLDMAQAAAALLDYPGISRRQSLIGCTADQKIVLVEDYAHHPTELAASLQVLEERYSARQMVVVFQPHRYQRLQHYFKEFVNILSNKNLQVKLAPVFSAWENPPIDGVDSADLAWHINAAGGHAEVIDSDYRRYADSLAEELSANLERTVVAVIGAGDVNKLTRALAGTLELES